VKCSGERANKKLFKVQGSRFKVIDEEHTIIGFLLEHVVCDDKCNVIVY
jgi:hypothetical protein